MYGQLANAARYLADESEAVEITDKLSGFCGTEYMGKSNYLLCRLAAGYLISGQISLFYINQ